MKTFFFKSSALSPNLVKSHHEAPFVIHFVNRRLWVKVKNKVGTCNSGGYYLIISKTNPL